MDLTARVRRSLHLITVLVALLTPAITVGDDAVSHVAFGAFYGSDGDDSGFEMSLVMEANELISGKVGGVLYVGRDPLGIEELFRGYSLTGYLHLANGMVEPMMGIGLFGGETFYCADVDARTGECRETMVLALYPEFGVAFNIYGVQFYPYMRRYYDTYTRGSLENTYGLQVGFGL